LRGVGYLAIRIRKAVGTFEDDAAGAAHEHGTAEVATLNFFLHGPLRGARDRRSRIEQQPGTTRQHDRTEKCARGDAKPFHALRAVATLAGRH